MLSRSSITPESVQSGNSFDTQASGESSAQSSSHDANGDPACSGTSTPAVDLWGRPAYGSACQCKPGSHCKLWLEQPAPDSGISSQPQSPLPADYLMVNFSFSCPREKTKGSMHIGLKGCHHREQGKIPDNCLCGLLNFMIEPLRPPVLNQLDCMGCTTHV